MKLVLRVVVGLSTAAAVYAGLLFLTLAVGGTECDRGECNLVGEVAVDEVGRWVLGLAFIALAVTLGVGAARRWVRQPTVTIRAPALREYQP